MRRATELLAACTAIASVSIHALLAESDLIQTKNTPKKESFYPRSPCGERPPSVLRHCTTYLFLSTLSLRRATVGTSQVFQRIAVSIHALLAESDVTPMVTPPSYNRFYPRSPCGERPFSSGAKADSVSVSIHALLAESDLPRCACRAYYISVSIHALLAESDDGPVSFFNSFHKVSIHALLAESDPV